MKNLANVVAWAMWIFTLLTGWKSPACLAETLFVPDPNNPNIQSAIINAQDGDTIIIASGIYTGLFNQDISFGNKAITLRSEDPNDPNVVMATIIDAAGSFGDEHRGFIFDSGEEANSVLEGVTIINGYALSGGGIRCFNSSPTIRYCIVSDNTSTGNGGGIYLETSAARISDCMINRNMALDGDGGGVSCLDSNSLLLERCRIYDNFADGGQSQGGGIYCDNSVLEVHRSRIYANRSVFGGGVYCFNNSVFSLSQSEILGNSAEGSGGGIYNQDSTVLFENCVFSGNRAFNGFGGALRCFSQGSAALNNSILWANWASLPGDGTGNEITLTPTSNEQIELTMAYSDLQGGLDNIVSEMDDGDVLLDWRAGNLDLDPLFIEPGSIDDRNTPGDLDDDVWNEGDYHLQAVSLVIDRGDPNSDFGNEPLPNGGQVNMGAFGNTSEATLSIRSSIALTKSSVKGDKKRLERANLDSIKLTGNLYASIDEADIEDFLSADTVSIRIDVVDGNDLPLSNILLDTFGIAYDPNQVAAKGKFSYKRPAEKVGAIAQFKIDYHKNTFSLDAKKVDLTGLRFPFKLEMAFGDYLGDVIVHNIEEMASKKVLPLCLLLGISDELEVTKAKVKTTNSGDSLTAQGMITAKRGNLDLTLEEITVRWGGINGYSETLDIGSFEEIKPPGSFRYKKPKENLIDTIRSLSIDLNKCRFKLSVKGAEPLMSAGSVTLEIFTTSENFDAVGVAEIAP